MTSGDGATAIVVEADAVWAGLPLSATVAVKVEVPLAVGVPEIVPVDDDRVNPTGNLPEVIDHL